MDWMKNPMVRALALGQLRAAATTLGGVLVTAGVLDKSQLGSVTGATMILAGVAYSAFDKFVVNRKVKAAVWSAPPGYVIVRNTPSEPEPGPQVTMAPIPNPPS